MQSRFLPAIRSFVCKELSGEIITSGMSMAPSIMPDEVLRIEPVGPRLKRGCCYVFYQENRMVCHRLAGFDAHNVWLVGDGCRNFEMVDRSAIIGRVVRDESGLLFLSLALLNSIILTLYNCNDRHLIRILYRIKFLLLPMLVKKKRVE